MTKIRRDLKSEPAFLRKLLIVIAVATASPAFAQAQDSSFCKQLGRLAETIARSRDEGVSFDALDQSDRAEVRERYQNHTDTLDEAAMRLVYAQIIAKAVYSAPDVSPAEFKRRYYMRCIHTHKDKDISP